MSRCIYCGKMLSEDDNICSEGSCDDDRCEWVDDETGDAKKDDCLVGIIGRLERIGDLLEELVKKKEG